MGIIQKNSFWNTVIGYAGVALGFVSAVLLFPRLLTTEEVGLTNILRSAGVLLAQMSALGGTNVVLRFFPFFRTDDGRFNGIFTLTFLISLIGVMLFSGLFILFRPAVVDYYSGESALFVKYCLFVIPISVGMVFQNLFAAWLRSMMKVVAAAVYIEIVLKICCMGALLLYAAGVVSFDLFIWLFCCGYGIPALGLLVHCWWRGMLSWDWRITPEMRTYIRPAVNYGLFCLFAGFGTTLVSSIDSLMLGSGVGLASVAVYGIVIYFISALQMPYRSMITAASPLVAQYWRHNKLRDMAALYSRFSTNITAVSLLLFVVVWANVDFVYSLMPAEYAAGKWALVIMFAGKFVDMAAGLNSTILSTSRHYRWDLWLAVMLIILAITTNSIFIPLWGIEGAALATTISVVAVNIARVWIVLKYYKMQPFTKEGVYATLIAVAALALITILPFTGHWLADIVLRTLAAGALFGLPVYLLRLSPDANKMAEDMVLKTLETLKLKRRG